jgi:hypothetical protein
MPQKLLSLSAKLWFLVAAIGQLAFVFFIVAYYGSRTLQGNFAAWNDKPVITGYVPGDRLGNSMFALHVLLGGVITLAGLLQLLPGIRQKIPKLHRWNGRAFIVLAIFMALGGVWMGLVRGASLSTVSTLSGVLGASLILLFCGMALFYARQRQFVLHKRWALRAFLAVSGVWFFRVGLMAWIIINQAPRGMNNTLSGPADIAIGFGSYLIPLACLELYFAAQKSSSPRFVHFSSLVILLMTALMAVGIVGTVLMMWWPYI